MLEPQRQPILGTGRSLREDLIWLRGFYSDDVEEASVEQYHIVAKPRTTRLLLCSPEDADSIWFWQCLENPWMIRDIHPTDGDHAMLNRYIPEHHDGKTPLQLTAVITAVALAWDNQSLFKFLEGFIAIIIATGVGPHDGDHYHTPLVLFLTAILHYSSRRPRDMRRMLLGWIKILQRAGVDLVSYGAEETRQHLAYRALEDPIPQRLYLRDVMIFTPALSDEVFYFTFSYGPEPHDWTVQLDHQIDQYVHEFWQMPGLLDDSEVRVVPGAWVDDG